MNIIFLTEIDTPVRSQKTLILFAKIENNALRTKRILGNLMFRYSAYGAYGQPHTYEEAQKGKKNRVSSSNSQVG